MTVLKTGPDIVSLPQRIRERWYLDAAKAEKARQALQVLQKSAPEEVERHVEGLREELKSQWSAEEELSMATKAQEDARRHNASGPVRLNIDGLSERTPEEILTAKNEGRATYAAFLAQLDQQKVEFKNRLKGTRRESGQQDEP
jgi:selenocysteine lyase/cysteine desulfurase